MLCDRPADGRAMAKAQPLGGTWFPASGNADGFVGLPPAQKVRLISAGNTYVLSCWNNAYTE